MSKMTQQRLESVVDLDAEVAQAVDVLVEHFSRLNGSTSILSYILNHLCVQSHSFSAKLVLSSQPVAARFLHDVLFSTSGAAAASPSSAPSMQGGSNFSVRSAKSAENMINLFAVTQVECSVIFRTLGTHNTANFTYQDADGSAMVLSRSLKEGHLVSEKTMTTVLELLLRQKDYG